MGIRSKGVCVADVFSLGIKRDPDVRSLTHIEGLISPVWMADSGSSRPTMRNRDGVFDFWILTSKVIKTADDDSITFREVEKVYPFFHSEGRAVSVTLHEVFVVPGCRSDRLSLQAWDRSGRRLVAH